MNSNANTTNSASNNITNSDSFLILNNQGASTANGSNSNGSSSSGGGVPVNSTFAELQPAGSLYSSMDHSSSTNPAGNSTNMTKQSMIYA